MGQTFSSSSIINIHRLSDISSEPLGAIQLRGFGYARLTVRAYHRCPTHLAVAIVPSGLTAQQMEKPQIESKSRSGKQVDPGVCLGYFCSLLNISPDEVLPPGFEPGFPSGIPTEKAGKLRSRHRG